VLGDRKGNVVNKELVASEKEFKRCLTSLLSRRRATWNCGDILVDMIDFNNYRDHEQTIALFNLRLPRIDFDK